MPGVPFLTVWTLTWLVQGIVAAFIAYNDLIALWGWSTPEPPLVRSHSQRFRVVVPAHDEERVIAGVLADLDRQDYPGDRYRAVVVADRCTDATAQVAGELAEVTERNEGAPGKGAALAWYLARDPLEADEALVVLDADNRLEPGFLAGVAGALEQGAQAVQTYLDVLNPDRSNLALASALSYWASNRMVHLARRNLGWSADLGGTGMCLTPAALEAVGGFRGDPTEDQELTARLLLAGIGVVWVHHVEVLDEKPWSMAVAVRQRARWAAGWRGLARRYAGSLLRAGWERRSWEPVDLAIRLTQPGRVFLALVGALLALVAALWPSGLWWPWWAWAMITALHVLLPLPFLVKEGVPLRYWIRYPVLVLIGLLWLPARLLGRRRPDWYHTPHGSP